MLKKIVLRSTETYTTINKRRRNETPYEKEDIVNEMFLEVLEVCCKKYDTSKYTDFSIYFNRAVSNRIVRMCNYKSIYNEDLKYVSMDNSIGGDDEYNNTLKDVLTNTKSNKQYNENLFWDGIKNSGFNPKEIKVIRCIYDNEKIRDIKKSLKITSVEYWEIHNKIKTVLQKNK